jgi:hypothetical protein
METLEWDKLRFGCFSLQTVRWAVDSKDWQTFRETLRGLPLPYRYSLLEKWVIDNNNAMQARIQVTNYVNALKRAGMLK